MILQPEDDSGTGKVVSGNFTVPTEYSNVTYWREPLPDIELELEDLKRGVESKSWRRSDFNEVPGLRVGILSGIMMTI